MPGCADCGSFGVRVTDSMDEDVGDGVTRSVEYYTCEICGRNGTLTILSGLMGADVSGSGVVREFGGGF